MPSGNAYKGKIRGYERCHCHCQTHIRYYSESICETLANSPDTIGGYELMFCDTTDGQHWN